MRTTHPLRTMAPVIPCQPIKRPEHEPIGRAIRNRLGNRADCTAQLRAPHCAHTDRFAFSCGLARPRQITNRNRSTPAPASALYVRLLTYRRAPGIGSGRPVAGCGLSAPAGSLHRRINRPAGFLPLPCTAYPFAPRIRYTPAFRRDILAPHCRQS